ARPRAGRPASRRRVHRLRRRRGGAKPARGGLAAQRPRHALPVRCRVKPLRVAAELALLPGAARRAGIELMHSLGTTTPLHGCGVRVVTVHDLIYDWYPGAFPTAARYGLKVLVPAGARRARRVQVSSEATRAEVRERFGLPAEKIDVVPLGLGMRRVVGPTPAEELRRRFELGDGPILLSVAAALPHKNLDRLVRAFGALGEADARLVLVGHAGRETERLRALAVECGVAERVRLTGWVADEDVEGFYAAAAAFVYPSLHEGFGMPVLEAMRRGVPTACADATSLPEVAGDAALMFDPRSEDAIAGALRALLHDPALAADLAARGPGRAAQFGWDRTAHAAWASYERAMADAARAPERR
ncbi:MAG TPA: glycosyltransferase family 1 protein, partial [Solirubrobacteraceae bacterium]|nr:glycosyltransferase family 1 protein [Solirubrobacteraceae bacterium]